MDKTCKFLGISVIIFKVLAWVSVVVGVISAIVIFIGGGTPEAPRLTGFVGLLLGVVYYFIFFTASGVISVLLDIRSKVDKGPSA
ncbi:MAG: hypothetical protein HQ566_05595 [Candidatus Omnitrophica bacterium]|nr:hypothetical protein [Candidatus Omnitrophota bacterium]